MKVQASQRRQKIAYDKHAKQRELTVGQAVWVRTKPSTKLATGGDREATQ